MALAAEAYDAEREHVDTSLEVRDAMGVRDLMLRLAALDKEADQVAALQDAILDRYRQRLAGIHEEQQKLRDSIDAFIRHVNGGEKVSIPDVGTAYLTTKNKGGKVKIADVDAFLTFLRNAQPTIVEAATIERVDERKALELLHDALFYTTPDGKIVERESGLLVEIDGLTVEPETKSLALRKA